MAITVRAHSLSGHAKLPGDCCSGTNGTTSCRARLSQTAFLGYVGAEPVASIWKAQPWSITIKNIFDGLLSLFTAGVFGWLWPH
jgi:hypothetical protein